MLVRQRECSSFAGVWGIIRREAERPAHEEGGNRWAMDGQSLARLERRKRKRW